MRPLPALLLSAAVCAHTPHLVPAPDAQRAPGNPSAAFASAAFASAAGVQLTVDPQRWQGEPRNLESIVTPLHATIENGSTAPIRIRYRDLPR